MEENLIIPQGGVISAEATSARFVLRQGDVEEWATAEYNAPLKGEPIIGWENSKPILKIGNGSDKWNELPGLGAEEHGGSWDAISLASDEENKEFMFEVNTKTLRLTTPEYQDTTGKIAAGLIYNAGQNGSYSYSDTAGEDMQVEGKSTFAVGRNIKIGANYANAFGSSHNITGYGGFAAGSGNKVIKFSSSNKNAQWAAAFGQTINVIGAASFGAGVGVNGIDEFLSTINTSMTNQEIYNKWKSLATGVRPSISYGDYSARFGAYNIAIGNNSFTAGSYNAAVGNNSVAFGENTWAEGDFSFVCGNKNTALNYGISAGQNNTAKGSHSILAGLGNSAAGYSAVFGQNNVIEGGYGIAAGYNNSIASSGASHSAVFGYQNHIKTGGYYSIVQGLNNLSGHNASAIFGGGLISSTNYGLTVGKFNQQAENALFVVGNGSGSPATDCTINKKEGTVTDAQDKVARSNAFVVYKDGHAEVTKDDPENKNSIPRMETVQNLISEAITVNEEADEGWKEISISGKVVYASKTFEITFDTNDYPELVNGYFYYPSLDIPEKYLNMTPAITNIFPLGTNTAQHACISKNIDQNTFEIEFTQNSCMGWGNDIQYPDEIGTLTLVFTITLTL